MDENKKKLSDRVMEIYCNMEDDDYCHLNVRWLANQLNVSEGYLSRQFKKEKKWNIRHSINYQKLSKAADLLIGTDMSVTEIAAYLDYSSPSYFARKFLDMWWIPATEFRVEARKEYEEFKSAESAIQIPTTRTPSPTPTGSKPGENPPFPPALEETEEPLLDIVKKRIMKYISRKIHRQ